MEAQPLELRDIVQTRVYVFADNPERVVLYNVGDVMVAVGEPVAKLHKPVPGDGSLPSNKAPVAPERHWSEPAMDAFGPLVSLTSTSIKSLSAPHPLRTCHVSV